MNPKVCIAVLAALCALNLANGQVATVIGAAIVAKAIWVKGIAIAAVAGGIGAGVGSGTFFGGRGHHKRSADQQPALPYEEVAFAMLANSERSEPEQCFRRLICTLATGSMKPSEFDIIPKFLSRKEVAVESPEFEYTTAAKLGGKMKNVQACELRYSCPLSAEEIRSLF
jgi:hypothetical protein